MQNEKNIDTYKITLNNVYLQNIKLQRVKAPTVGQIDARVSGFCQYNSLYLSHLTVSGISNNTLER